jgi:hypothetical protein
MNTLIEYIPKKSTYNLFLEMIHLFPLTLGLLFIAFGYWIIKIDAIYISNIIETVKTNTQEKIKTIIKYVLKIILSLTIFTTMFYFASYIYNKAEKQQQEYQPKAVSILNIKDQYTINADKIIIKPLKENYRYKDDKLDKNKEQIFKIEYDEFYDKYFLTDANLNRHEISKEEYIKLKQNH